MTDSGLLSSWATLGEEISHRRELLGFEQLMRTLLDLRFQVFVLPAKVLVEKSHLDQIAHAQEQLDLLEGLGDEIARAGLERRSLALARHVGGQHEHGQIRLGPPRLEASQHLDAVEVGHAEIQQDQIGLELGAEPEHLARVARAPELPIAGVAEQLLQETHHRPLVVDDQDPGVAEQLRHHELSPRSFS